MTTAPFRITSMAGASDAYAFILACKRAKKDGVLRLDMSSAGGVYPNGVVPMVVAHEYYKREGLRFRYDGLSSAITEISFLNPPRATPENLASRHLTHTVWRYEEDDTSRLADAFIDHLEDRVVCGDGVLEALNWCLFEVMDNVFQHSHAECGYAMMQIHKKNRLCAVAVGDDGIGIHRSFRDNNVYRVSNAYEAISLAVQEKVTSKPKNMGNGLYGLMRIVGLNQGSMEIRSGRGYMSFVAPDDISGDASNSWPLLDAEDHQGTTVDWQLDLHRSVSLADALRRERTVNLRVEALEDEDGVHTVRVADFEEGLGTRRSAEQIRTKLMNLLGQGVPRLTLDFDGVSVVSSSFADEVLGKLALQMGEGVFLSKFQFANMSTTVHAVIDRAIEQRLSEGDIGYPARP